MLKNIHRYLKSKHLKSLKKHFNKLQKYQYDIDLFNDINAFPEARTLLNERRSNLFHEETKRIRKELYKKEAVYNFL